MSRFPMVAAVRPLLRAAVICLGMVSLTAGQQSGTSSTAFRQEAASAIPYRALRPDVAQQIQAVVSDTSIYRRLPVRSMDCDPKLFTFLVRNPDVVVGIWERMGMTQLTMGRIGTYAFESTDGLGTTSRFQLVYGTPNVHVYYGTGYYEGSLLRNRIHGRCVLLLRSKMGKSNEGRDVIFNSLDVFVAIDNGAVDLAAKTLYPLFIRAADSNFVTTSSFVSELSHAAQRNEEGMTDLASQLTRVDTGVRSEFMLVVHEVASRPKPGRNPK